MGCARWEGDLRNTVADGKGKAEQRVLSRASFWLYWGSQVVSNQGGDAGPPSVPHLNALGQWLSIPWAYQSARAACRRGPDSLGHGGTENLHVYQVSR